MYRVYRIISTAVLTVSFVCSAAGGKANFMWKVENAAGKDKVYLLGSVHIVPDDIYPLSKKITDAYDSSTFVVVEADMNTLDQAKVQQLTLENGIYTDGSTLETELSESLYAKLAATLEYTGIFTIEQMNPMKPWLAALMIPQLMISKMGYRMDNGIDMHFLRKAAKDKKSVFELESAEFQMELMSSFTDDQQKKLLESTLNEVNNFKMEFDSMIKAWIDDDIVKMEKILNNEYDNNPGLAGVYKKLVYDRNVGMTSKIDGYLKDKRKSKFFIIVGAAHLIDKDGIVSMLGKKGYKVKKM
jgi:uncharacterized protein